MPLTVLFTCIVSLVIIGLAEDCLMVRCDRKKLKRDLDLMTDRYDSIRRRVADLSHDCQTLREHRGVLLAEMDQLIQNLRDQTLLVMSYQRLYDAVVGAAMKD